jgi:hypothetical protein
MANYLLFNTHSKSYIRLNTLKIEADILKKFYDLHYIKNNAFIGTLWSMEKDIMYFITEEDNDLLIIPQSWIEVAIPIHTEYQKNKEEWEK